MALLALISSVSFRGGSLPVGGLWTGDYSEQTNE